MNDYFNADVNLEKIKVIQDSVVNYRLTKDQSASGHV